MRKNKLLAAAVVAIFAVAFAPHALDAWRDYKQRGVQEEQKRVIEVKQREIACLERLAATLRPGADVDAEIERCRQAAAAAPG